MQIADAVLLKIYTDMVRSRALDEKLIAMFAAGKLVANWHSGWGEEAGCAAYSQLRPDDYCGYTHRGTLVFASKGIPFGSVIAEWTGKATGSSKGKGGTHVVDMARGVVGRSAMQGGHFPMFTGIGVAIQVRGTDQVSMVSFGDGAATSGMLHEAMNFAAVWKLPVIFLCLNNECSETERLDQIWGQPDIAKMGIPYGIPYEIVGDNDAMGLAIAAASAIRRARAGEGPTILELKTFRMRAHFERDPWDFPDRTVDEISAWRNKDAIAMMEGQLLTRGLLTPQQADAIKQAAAAEVDEAERFADRSPPPADEEAFTEIYASLPYERIA